MVSNSIISQEPGNTPVKKIPNDYYPANCGFWFKIPNGLDSAKKMFYQDHEYGNGTSDKTVVFVHGNPECSYTYRKIIKILVKEAKKPFRIIAMDHIGFGLSDQATYEMVCMDHADNLFQLIKKLDLTNVTLIVHDWGGPIGIGAFLQEPERVSNLILLNTTVFPIANIGLTYNNYPISWLSWSKVPYIIPNRFWGGFASYAIFTSPASPFKLLINMIRHIALATIGIDYGIEFSAKRVFRKQFRSKMNTLSSKRLVLQTKRFAHGNIYKEPTLGRRNTQKFYEFIQSIIAKRWGIEGQNIGVKAILGRWDPLAQNNVIKQWIDHLPQLKGHVKIYRESGHFIEEDRPKIIANAILEAANLK